MEMKQDIMFFYMLAIMLCFFVSFINSASISSVENQELSISNMSNISHVEEYPITNSSFTSIVLSDSREISRVKRSEARSSYYEFLITEGSYKFWAVFQVFTAVLLIYSAFAAIWYTKYTFANTDYPDYEDDFFVRRSGPMQSVPGTVLGVSGQHFQTIMDSIYSNKYS